MANLINADPTAGLKLVSSSSSDIQIQSNGVTVCTINADGLSMNTGTLAGNGPAFSAYSSVIQSITSATWTKVVCGTELFDTNSNYDIATARFTPTVEGYYQITSRIQTSTATRVFTQLYKNGVSFKHLLDIPSNITRSGGSALVYMNGSTDYIELYAYLTGSGLQVQANQIGTYFEAAMIRGA